MFQAQQSVPPPDDPAWSGVGERHRRLRESDEEYAEVQARHRASLRAAEQRADLHRARKTLRRMKLAIIESNGERRAPAIGEIFEIRVEAKRSDLSFWDATARQRLCLEGGRWNGSLRFSNGVDPNFIAIRIQDILKLRLEHLSEHSDETADTYRFRLIR